jgi:hypothetical protein
LATAAPDFPDGVVDRDADCWEPLLAIADAAGDAWPQRARAAAVALVGRGADSTRTAGVQLLGDLREVFGGAERLATSVILERLHNLPESSWRDIRGKALDDRGLSWRLKKYGVKPKSLRLNGSVLRGYEAADLADAFARYLPYPGTSATSATGAERYGKRYRKERRKQPKTGPRSGCSGCSG